MKSQGTKETQGINGDAAALAARDTGALRLVVNQSGPMPPCSYPAHRATDWRLDQPGSPAVCGICHAPPTDADGTPLVAIRRRRTRTRPAA